MKLDVKKIIIQAGGKGTRLEGLTKNKPKCLVPVNNLPIIFYLFQAFKAAEFSIIADYKADVLEKYLDTFASEYKYKIIKLSAPLPSTPNVEFVGQGSASGIKEAVSVYNEDEPFMIIWSDLILSTSFIMPSIEGNYIGISKDFECRWSYINNKFVKEPSKENGVAGLFVLKNKAPLENIPEKGSLVHWFQTQNIKFNRVNLYGSKEIGTMLSYADNNLRRFRSFNSIEFKKDVVIKQGINIYGKKIAVNETSWYKHVKKLGYKNIPQIYNYNPLVMKYIQGKNIYEYDCLTRTQKQDILKNIINALENLHNCEPSRPVNIPDVQNTFFSKTFKRLTKVKYLIPFANQEFIKINGSYYKNIFFNFEELKTVIQSIYPKEFKLIHGDCTFSNLIFDTYNIKTVLIDPRGYFGTTKLYGDVDYDWAKLYYSLKGNYDQFNSKKFTLNITSNHIEFAIRSNNWEDMEEFFFDSLPYIDKYKLKVLHAIIWLSLTTYTWEDYDGICVAFYNGLIKLGEVL